MINYKIKKSNRVSEINPNGSNGTAPFVNLLKNEFSLFKVKIFI